MARAASTTDIEIPLIEEQVETGLGELLAGYKPAYKLTGEKKNELLQRFTVLTDKPLPEFDHRYAQAFEARDDFNPTRPIYAMVCDASLPYSRYQATVDLIDYVHPNITNVLGAGRVLCAHVNEMRQVIFLERPMGRRLTSVLNGGRLHEHKLIDFVLNPACKALTALREKKVSHGNIHPGAFFLDEETMLAECVSMPCGTMGHYLYEPVERLMADPLAHGEATEKTDIYALAVLVMELMYGLDAIKAVPRAEFMEQVMRVGAYQVFTTHSTPSEALQDFFRGALNDDPAERWGLSQLTQWLGGKRFNMIAPVAPKEGSRPLTFAGREFFNRRLLAHALHRNWREALTVMKSLKLDRWCDISLHRPELGEHIDRALRAGLDRKAKERQISDMMTRVITVLDPAGPLRTMSCAVRPDAIGFMLAEAVERGGPEMQQLLNLVEFDMASYWTDMQTSNHTAEMSTTLRRMQRARTYLKRKTLGFSLERVLYELNPSLHCQSALLKPYLVMNILDALKTLDALAPTLAADTNLLDRHLAAFIACKTELGKEIRIGDGTMRPGLANNEELMMLRLLSRAQQRHPNLKLVGLSAWAALRVEKMIDEIHNRLIRKRLKLKLKKRALTGNIHEVVNILLDAETLKHDHSGFSQAIALHSINTTRLERLSSDEILTHKSKLMGGKMATIISNMGLMVMGYLTLASLLGI